MSLLVRKIELGKWKQNQDLNELNNISADVITNCLKTKGNTISTWKIDSEDNLSDAVLAMISTCQHLDTINVVCLSGEVVTGNGLELNETPAKTPIEKFNNTHVDICNLTYLKIGKVADIIRDIVINDKYVRYTSNQLKGILQQAIANKILIKDQLAPDVQKKI